MDADRPRRDGGFTLIETLLAVVVTGVLMSALSMTVVVTLNALPSAEYRLDDSRMTRGLSTWLSHDTVSAPPFRPATAQGGVNVTAAATTANNDCNAPGTNLLHLQWVEDAHVSTTFVANYRYVIDADGGSIMRFTCSRTGADPFGNGSRLNVMTDLDPATTPLVTVDQPAGMDVRSISFSMVGESGQPVTVVSASRNPAEFFP